MEGALRTEGSADLPKLELQLSVNHTVYMLEPNSNPPPEWYSLLTVESALQPLALAFCTELTKDKDLSLIQGLSK